MLNETSHLVYEDFAGRVFQRHFKFKLCKTVIFKFDWL